MKPSWFVILLIALVSLYLSADVYLSRTQAARNKAREERLSQKVGSPRPACIWRTTTDGVVVVDACP
jgi:hypothetical protein